MLKILNLYAGIGGNRKLWGGDIDVTAIEMDEKIAKIYQDFFPNDKVIIGDAHQFLLTHFREFDFIWTSCPCPSHSRTRKCNHVQNKPIYPDMKLYEEIIFLQHYFKGKFVVENVFSYYEPLIKPYIVGKHYYWTNFPLNNISKLDNQGRGMGKNESLKNLYKLKEFNLSKYKGIDKMKIMRNCVEPKEALHIFNMAFREVQEVLK